jgi:hypothetical protein
MLMATELQLNRIAQGLISVSDGNAWFEALSATERREVLSKLALICTQSHPRADEVLPAIARAGLKPTFTPCVML